MSCTSSSEIPTSSRASSTAVLQVLYVSVVGSHGRTRCTWRKWRTARTWRAARERRPRDPRTWAHPVHLADVEHCAGAFSSPRAPPVPGGPCHGPDRVPGGAEQLCASFTGSIMRLWAPRLRLDRRRPTPACSSICDQCHRARRAARRRRYLENVAPAQGPPRARARPAQGPLIFYGTARRILDSQGFGVLISLNLQNQGFGRPCCKT